MKFNHLFFWRLYIYPIFPSSHTDDLGGLLEMPCAAVLLLIHSARRRAAECIYVYTSNDTVSMALRVNVCEGKSVRVYV